MTVLDHAGEHIEPRRERVRERKRDVDHRIKERDLVKLPAADILESMKQDHKAQELDPGLPAMKALGVQELGRHLRGEMTLEDAAQAGKQATRNFAKRQLTWLRNQVVADCVIEAAYGPGHRDKAFSFVRDFLAASGG